MVQPRAAPERSMDTRKGVQQLVDLIDGQAGDGVGTPSGSATPARYRASSPHRQRR